MSFAQHEMEVIRIAEVDGLKNYTESSIAILTARNALEMPAATDLEAEDIAGNIAAMLILYCAKRDIDLTRCLRDAVERMK